MDALRPSFAFQLSLVLFKDRMVTNCLRRFRRYAIAAVFYKRNARLSTEDFLARDKLRRDVALIGQIRRAL